MAPKSKPPSKDKTASSNSNGTSKRNPKLSMRSLPRMHLTTVPAARSVIMRNPQMVITSVAGSTRIRNTENVINVITITSVPTILSLNLIPGSFPWLAGVAVNYSKWRWISLQLIYIPFCGTSTSGRYTMGFQYDTNDTLPTTLAALQSLNRSITGPVWGESGGPLVTNFDSTKVTTKYYPFITLTDFLGITAIYTRNIYCPSTLAYGTDNGTAILPLFTGVGALHACYEIELIEPTPAASNS